MNRQGPPSPASKWAAVCAVVVAALLPAPAARAGTCTITINPLTLPGGTVGVPYSQTITGSNCSPPYTFAITSGFPPPGLSLGSATTTTTKLQGTPTTAGSFTFTVGAIDQFSNTGS